MKICSSISYDELGKNKKLLSVKGEFSDNYISITFTCGSLREPTGKNGLAHLTEHIYLRKIEESYRRKHGRNLTGSDIHYMGYTDYSCIYLIFRVSEQLENFVRLQEAILDNIIIDNIDDSLLEDVKNQVVEECNNREKEISNDIFVNNFLNDCTDIKLPIGEKEAIRNISMQDIVWFSQEVMKNFTICLYSNFNSEVSKNFAKNYMNRFKKSSIVESEHFDLELNNKIEGNSYIVRIQNSKKLDQIKVYYKTEVLNTEIERNTIIEKILDLIISSRITKWLDNNDDDAVELSFAKKWFQGGSYFKIISLKNFNVDNADKIVDGFKAAITQKVTGDEFEVGKKHIGQLFKEIKEYNKAFIFESVNKNILFHEAMFLTEQSIINAINLLDLLEINEINRLYNKIYNQEYKVVINYRSVYE